MASICFSFSGSSSSRGAAAPAPPNIFRLVVKDGLGVWIEVCENADEPGASAAMAAHAPST
eukprot:5967083-Ditylum_brightwellii.AAC.1